MLHVDNNSYKHWYGNTWHGAYWCILIIIGKPSMNKVTLSWFHNVMSCNGEIIENWTLIESKIKITMGFGCTLGIVGKP